MASVTVSSILGNIEKYRFNPAQMQRASLEVLRATTDGTVEIVDATNPFVFALETTATNTAAFMQYMEALTRRQYPASALTQEDLYLHMSDKDYIGRFATPAATFWTLMFRKDEVINAMVLDPIAKIKKITIPRNTVFRVAETPFSLQYPIDIRQLDHGGLQVVYDTAVPSPLQELTTNLIEFEEITAYDGITFIKFNVEVNQFDIVTKYNDVNAASGFVTTISHPDKFYHARVYIQQSDSSWKEIQTTHTQQIYDPRTPTAVLQVHEGKISVTIPSVYVTSGKVRGKLRTDVFYTKGPVVLMLSGYQLDNFSTEWRAIDAADSTQYTAPVVNLSTVAVFSTATVSGGRDSLSVDTLRQRVIDNNLGPQQLPITNIQLQSSVEDMGYEIVKNVDTITNRIFLATKPLPTPVDLSLITPAASGMATVLLSFDECRLAYGVIDNGTAVTLTSSALFITKNGVTKLVSKAAYENLTAMSPALLCAEINKSNYSFTPFYYVLDTASDIFEIRPYYLETPKIVSKTFIKDNVSTQLQVSVDTTSTIEKFDNYYKLTINTRSNDTYKALEDKYVFAQLFYSSSKQAAPAYLKNETTYFNSDGERVFEFVMRTEFALDVDDTLDQTSFTVSRSAVVTRCDLLQDFKIVFGCILPTEAQADYTSIDESLSVDLLQDYVVNGGVLAGISLESLRIEFGHSLKTLWAQGKSVPGSIPYQKYEEDVPLVYETDVFELDPVTGSAFTLDANGELVYKYLHRAGDPVLDAQGRQKFKHLKGETAVDSNGLPITQSDKQSSILHLVDVFTIESAYKFANDKAAADYRNYFAASLVGWLTNDLESLSQRLLDQTKVYFYPRVTKGNIRILSTDGIESTIDASQAFKITLSVPDKTYVNSELLDALKKTTIRTLDESLKTSTVAVSAIEYALRNRYGNDVIDVKLEPVGWVADYNAITVLDNSNRLSIKKRLTPQQDGRVIVEEDVEVTFVRHGNVTK